MPRPVLTIEAIREYKKDVELNAVRLEIEIDRQAGLFAWWGELSAGAKALLASLKLKEDILEARLDATARRELTGKDLKVTDSSIKAFRESQKEWQVLAASIIDAQEMVDIADAVKNALFQKSKMIEARVMLRRMEYGQPGETGVRDNPDPSMATASLEGRRARFLQDRKASTPNRQEE